MILTPIPQEKLPDVIGAFRIAQAGHALAAPALTRIAATMTVLDARADLPAHRQQARDLARAFGIPLIDVAPSDGFSWDGHAIACRSEASVLIHEVAHWLLAPPERRRLPDFGLGAGPETGRRVEADRARAVDAATEQEEESLASLLGILWEAELGQPAILAFLEQNWLEGHGRCGTVRHFQRHLELLAGRGLIDGAARPLAPSTLAGHAGRFPERGSVAC
ncbi:MAG: elongation factor P hydroxylase [Alphaproteobacteria bacterium]|nr:elongation factor P hydroxylase [Alphaproteobacteria bacterium]